MKIDKIISLANQNVRLQFLAMERSLRATGCQLPLLVIPYDDQLFELPKGSTWWKIPEVTEWLNTQGSSKLLRKYQCLLTENYQFVDSDICFLRNPEQVLEPYSGFITSCGHWHDAAHCCTELSQQMMLRTSTTWQKHVFNSGQFACDRPLFDFEQLKATATQPDFVETCVHFSVDQPAINLLVFSTEVEITNLTLPPLCMESTWAGDYPGEYKQYWKDPQRQPYLIHWAGTKMDIPRPINEVFYDYLTAEEKTEWDEKVKISSIQRRKQNRSPRAIARKFKRAIQTLVQNY